jgi:hypothetical protein
MFTGHDRRASQHIIFNHINLNKCEILKSSVLLYLDYEAYVQQVMGMS